MYTEGSEHVKTDNVQAPLSDSSPPGYSCSNPMAVNSKETVPAPPVAPSHDTDVQRLAGPNTLIFQQPESVILHHPHVSPSETSNIKDYLLWSIFNVVCCGLLFGIIGVLLSFQVRLYKMHGNIDDARRLSTGTAIWNAFTSLVGIGVIIAIVVYLVNNRSS